MRLLAIPFGFFFAGFGTLALLSVFGLVPSHMGRGWPAQVFVASAGAVFMCAGLGVMLFGLGRERAAARMGGIALLCFVLAFNWIAFGPGERHFTRQLKTGVSQASASPVPEWQGRLVFGAVAGLMDAVLLVGLVKGRRRKP